MTTSSMRAGVGGAGIAELGPRDLAELAQAFTEATARLQTTHEALHAQVAQLKAELAEAREQVERSRRLAALGEMAAGIAHEIRNPLGAMSLDVRLLRQDLEESPPQRAVAERVARAVARLNAVVGDVLSFSREMTVREGEALEAVELMESALESARDGGAAWSRVEVRGPESMGRVPAIRGDAGLLRQALVNVIRNAAEAMEGQARPAVLTLTARARRGNGGGGGSGGNAGLVGLIVSDTGPGIPAEVRSRMFNPFFTTRAAGTGLGLAIVHRIVDAHGGRVKVRNVGGGAGAGGEAAGGGAAGGPAGGGGSGVVGGAEVELQLPAWGG